MIIIFVIAVFALVIWYLMKSDADRSKKSGRNGSQNATKTEQGSTYRPDSGAASQPYWNYPNEKAEKIDDIKVSVKLLQEHFEVPYPVLHFLGDNDDCLYFEIDDALRSARKGSTRDLYKAITKTMDAIFKHVSLFPHNVSLQIEQLSDKKDGENEMGSYTNNGSYYGHILVKYQAATTTDELIALLAHECMHHLLHIHRVRFEDTMKNEILTDIAVIFFGLGATMTLGYEKQRHVVHRDETTTVISQSKLGYINKAEVRVAAVLCDTLRKEWIRNKNREIKQKDERLERVFVLNKSLFEQSLSAPPRTVDSKTYNLLMQNAMEMCETPDSIEGKPDISELTIDGDYLKIYHDISQTMDELIERYNNYNMALNTRLGYM